MQYTMKDVTIELEETGFHKITKRHLSYGIVQVNLDMPLLTTTLVVLMTMEKV